MVVDLADAVNDVFALESDEAESAVALRLLVHQHDGLLDASKLIEVGLDFVGRRVLTDAADEDLLGLGRRRRFAFVLGRRVLRVDLLAVERVRRDGQHAIDAARFGEGDEAKASAPLRDRSIQHNKKKRKKKKESRMSLSVCAISSPSSSSTTASRRPTTTTSSPLHYTKPQCPRVFPPFSPTLSLSLSRVPFRNVLFNSSSS